MQRNQLASVMVMAAGCAVGLSAALASPANASTVAYWRFEDGPADTDITHLNGIAGSWSADVLDVSGNNHHLSTWETGGNAGYIYKANVPASPVVQTSDPNNFSAKNTGGGPAMWNESLSSWSPSAWTIEVSFKIEANNHKTIIGRDSQGGFTDGSNQDLAALYLQKTPGEGLAINFQDSAGYFHETISADGIIQGYDFGTDPNGDTVPWYSAAAVSDGSTVSLYLMDYSVANPTYTLVAQTDLTLSGSTDTSLSAGHGDGGDWDAGNFSVGRGLYGGTHGDRAYGYIDEVRFSDTAMATNEFLFADTVLVGDLDLDGFVGITDLNLVLSNWNENPPDVAAADPSGDGFVGIEDLNVVLGNWNAGTPPASVVPEPATLALLSLSGLAVLRRR